MGAMMTDPEVFEALSKLVAADIPKFSNRWKLTIWWNLLVAVVLWPFNRRYLTGYITTNYPHVDWPQQSPEPPPLTGKCWLTSTFTCTTVNGWACG
jgi:hypothetical protein